MRGAGIAAAHPVCDGNGNLCEQSNKITVSSNSISLFTFDREVLHDLRKQSLEINISLF